MQILNAIKLILGFIFFIHCAPICSLAFGTNCPSLAEQLENSPNAEVAPWSIERNDLRLTVEQLLPQTYIQKILEIWQEMPRLQISNQPFQDKVKIIVEVKLGNETFVKISLRESDNKESVALDDLRMEDITSLEIKNLKVSQKSKGMPLNVFFHLRKRLERIAAAGGFKSMQSSSQQNFNVVMLYRKVVGMEAANEKSAEVLSQLDRLYEIARKEFPESLRPESMDAFARMLGAVGERPAALNGMKTPSGFVGPNMARRLALDRYHDTGVLPNGLRLIHDKNQNAVAIEFPPSQHTDCNIIFLNPLVDRPTFLQWSDIASSGSIVLKKDVAPATQTIE
jgi:hypothetical protein